MQQIIAAFKYPVKDKHMIQIQHANEKVNSFNRGAHNDNYAHLYNNTLVCQ